ncbi:hypothetical protein OG874_10960 [Nocardia sp. NBC_00565]|uniref:hypothetical protein n=1 Tax=Nocardia sp. NBC_00565 TaxID=2975993 RepID=UPI002E81979C|nr:hypothetical protein [Nocardia sp. NBC_00565]WUC05623.1 hypothetical protein OG874_10960 [Nocardia sp. NBC_00565]
MTDLVAGKRLRSTVCDTEIIVIRVPETPIELQCGGQPMAADAAGVGTAESASGTGTLLGKRYVDDATGLEVLCTKSGTGTLAADGRELTIKAPKALPASD